MTGLSESEILAFLTKAAKHAEKIQQDPRNDRDTEFYTEIERKLHEIRLEILDYKIEEEF